MSDLNQLIIDLGNIQKNEEKLLKIKNEIDVQLQLWEKQKAQYNKKEVLSVVSQPNKFEGVVAERIKWDLDDCFRYMEDTYKNMIVFQDALLSQITKLDYHARRLQQKIDKEKAKKTLFNPEV